MNIPDDILLEEYFDKRTIKPLRRETLIKKLKLLAKWYKWDTENSIMIWLWAYKIYDAGNYKYTYKI